MESNHEDTDSQPNTDSEDQPGPFKIPKISKNKSAYGLTNA